MFREHIKAIRSQVVAVLFFYFVLSSIASSVERAVEWHYYQLRVSALHQLLDGTKNLFDLPTPNPDGYRRQPPPLDPDSLHFFSIKDSSPTMRVYLTAAFQRQREMRQYAEQLRAEGVEVVSAWHDLDSPSTDGFHGVGQERLAWLAMLDIQQLSGGNAVVVFSDRYATQSFASGLATADVIDGRKHVDTGIGLALGKRLLLVGPSENCYHALPDVEHFPAWPDCFARILELRATDAMTTRQAAAEAGTTVKQIVTWIRDGSLPAAKRNGQYIVGRNDLDRRKAQQLRARADELTVSPEKG